MHASNCGCQSTAIHEFVCIHSSCKNPADKHGSSAPCHIHTSERIHQALM